MWLLYFSQIFHKSPLLTNFSYKIMSLLTFKSLLIDIRHLKGFFHPKWKITLPLISSLNTLYIGIKNIQTPNSCSIYVSLIFSFRFIQMLTFSHSKNTCTIRRQLEYPQVLAPFYPSLQCNDFLAIQYRVSSYGLKIRK